MDRRILYYLCTNISIFVQIQFSDNMTERNIALASDDLKEVFDTFDADNDGEITVQELQKVWFN